MSKTLRQASELRSLQAFKTLEKYGVALKATLEKGFHRSIRFDDCEMSLSMNIKLPMDTEWKTVSSAIALEENWSLEKK